MKTDKKKYIKYVVFSIILLYVAVVYLTNRQFLFCIPFQETELSDIAGAVLGKDGRLYILDQSGYELVCVDDQGQMVYKITETNDNGSGFVQGLDIIVDEENNVYVQNRMASEDAYAWIGSESILKFDTDGNYIDCYINKEYQVPRLKTNILKLLLIDGKACYFYTTDNKLTLAGLEEGIILDLIYPDANAMIAGAAYDETSQTIYLTTLDGKIQKYCDGELTTIFEADSTINRANPRDVAIDGQGNILIADLGYREIRKIEENAYVPYIFGGEFVADDQEFTKDEILEQYVPYSINGGYGIVYNEIDQLGIIQDHEITNFSVYQYNTETNIRIILVVLAEILFGALLLLLAVKGIGFILRSESKTVRIITVVIAGVVILTAVFTALAMKDFKQRLVNEMFSRQTMAASVVNQLLPKEEFQQLNGVEDFRSEAYLKVKKVVDDVILDENHIPGDIYLVIYSLEEDELILRYALEETQGCWYPYIWSDGTDEQSIYENGEIEYFYGEEDSEGSYMLVYAPLTNDAGDVIGVIEVGTDMTVFSEQNQQFLLNLFINIFVVAVVSILLVLEAVVFLNARKSYIRRKGSDIHKSYIPIPVDMYRIIVFIVFFATNLTTPFLSIYGVQLASEMDQLYGISPEIWAAVPISAEVLFGALFSVFGNVIIRKLGKRKAGILGGIMFTAGLCIRFIMPSLWLLTIGNAIQGAGWGIVLLIVNVEYAERESEEERELGYTGYNIALQNGINSGIVAGGFLMVFMDYQGVMITAAIISAIVLLFCICYLDAREKKQMQEEVEEKKISLLKFLFSRNVIAYYICIVIPVIAASYYLNYLYPIIAEDAGMSETYIGYSYLLNGLVVICLGNLIVNFMSKHFNRKVLMLIASIIYTICFVMVGWFQSIPALLIVLILLAVSDSFGYVAQSSFYNDLKEVEAYGYDRAAGVYSLLENFSQTAGSFIFGYILTVGLKEGMIIYGIVILITAVIFVIAAKEPKRQNKESADN